MQAAQLKMRLIAAVALLILACGAQAASTQLANAPMSSASSVEISTNILFVLDDSLSMSWEQLPDWAKPPLNGYGSDLVKLLRDLPLQKNSAFNGINYDPTVRYIPPKYFTEDGVLDTSTYPSQTATQTNNWTAVKDDGYGVQSSALVNLVGNAYYFKTVVGEYCTNRSLKSCQANHDATHTFAAKLRWCKTALAAAAATPADGDCQATQVEPNDAVLGHVSYSFPRMPSPRTSTITIIPGSSTQVSSITVDGLEILSHRTNARTNATNMATDIAGRINACSFGIPEGSSCQVAGYRAISVDNTVVISAPGTPGAAPAITKDDGSMSFTPTAFERPASNLAPGENLMTLIASGNSYPKTEKRTDCAGVLGASGCSYDAEMTNFANWWAYYRTRMQTMKTATSRSFEPTDQRQRIGYMSINNNTGSDFLNLGSFTAAWKKAWYDKLFAAKPNGGTPLRVALSNAGRLYAGQLNGTTFNGVPVVDPVQYYCQKNVTILSTDGYWNEGAGFRWDGSTEIGDQDGPDGPWSEERPQLDGGGWQDEEMRTRTTRILTPTLPTEAYTRTEQIRARTAELQTSTRSKLQASYYRWQESISLLQGSRTGPLQSRKKTLEIQRAGPAYQTSELRMITGVRQMKTSVLQQRLTQVQQSTSSNGGSSYGDWSTINIDSSCTPVTSGNNRVQCQTLSPTGWSEVERCTEVAGGATVTNPGSDNQTTTYTTKSECRYSDPGWTDSECTEKGTPSTAPQYTVARVVTCQTKWAAQAQSTERCEVSDTALCFYGTPSQWQLWTGEGPCTNVPESTASPYTVSVARLCGPGTLTTTPLPWAVAGAAGCTPVAGSVQCRFGDNWSEWADDSLCAAVDEPRSRDTVSSTTPIPVQCRVNGDLIAVPSCTVKSSGAIQTECVYSEWTSWDWVDACTRVPQSRGEAVARKCHQEWTPYADAAICNNSDTTKCQYDFTEWTQTDSCTQSPDLSVPNATDCQYAPWSSFGNAPSCKEALQSDDPPIAVECDPQLISDWAPSDRCNEGTSDSGLVTSCKFTVPAPQQQFVPPNDCVAQAADPVSNGGIETSCPTETRGPTKVGECTSQPATANNEYWEVTCNPPLSLGPTPNTLADVAEYYFKTDLRDSVQIPGSCSGGPVFVAGVEVTPRNDVCYNDPALALGRQYMSTYTLGLGASGLMQYDKNYNTAQADVEGDFVSIKQPKLANTATGVCPWQKSGVCNWPKPVSDTQTNIDDLWHAAVNGRGIYFNASDPSTLAAGISDALSDIEVKAGALAAVSVVSPNLVAGANGLFEISFKVGEWSGEVVKRTIDGSSGELSPLPAEGAAHDAPGWSARAQLDNKVATDGYESRRIYTYNSAVDGESADGAADKLKFFTWENLTTERPYFEREALEAALSQFCETGTTCLDAGAKTAAVGAPLVNFLRGDRAHEGPDVDLSAYFRQRTHLLGDIVGSEATYVQAPPWNYADAQYGAFKTDNSGRTAMLYVGANDGMLHAFNATSGEEEWAYIPAIVMPRLAKLADKSYGVEGSHQFTVDGTPVMGDICSDECGTSSAVWKTILVGGLNNGGRGYYALDITNPAEPKALWEFTHNDLGYSYGNPVITKLKNGTWVVIVASGYNNNVSPGDGGGHLFILDAASGERIRTISTGVGNAETPSGLSRIAAWANFPDNNNTALRVYGGDQFGNLWRFDVNGDIPLADTPVYDAQLLATLKDAAGVAQPITTKPELGKVGSHPVVFVATGQLLGPDDLGTRQTHSMYAITDRLLTGSDGNYGNPRLVSAQDDEDDAPPVAGTFVKQELSAGTCPANNAFCTLRNAIVTTSKKAVDFNTHAGWYIDFLEPGERVNTEIRLQLGTLAFNTNKPTGGACQPIGVSFAYFLDYRSGAAVEGTDGIAGVRLGNYLSASPSIIRLENGTIRALVRTDAPSTISAPVPAAPSPFDTRRVSWRELVTEQ